VKVSLFITCLADQMFPEVGLSAVRVLRRFGCEVDFPEAQVCCGQPAFNSGYRDEARSVARTLLDAFEASEHVVSPSGSCTGMIHHYYEELFRDEPEALALARRLRDKTREFSQFLRQVLGIEQLAARFPESVTYHASCHGSRLLGAKREPLELLNMVEGIELRELPRCEDCCGFGGTFSVKLSDLSAAMADEKVTNIESTGARYLVGTDMGCLMNIAGRMRRRRVEVEALHLAELLDRALANAEGAKTS
jgi:L-lactate dehydrogenase complex protein LldE